MVRTFSFLSRSLYPALASAYSMMSKMLSSITYIPPIYCGCDDVWFTFRLKIAVNFVQIDADVLVLQGFGRYFAESVEKSDPAHRDFLSFNFLCCEFGMRDEYVSVRRLRLL